MKKGFTLIELLAVIVVLAIIAVIAVPTITNVVNKARIGALKSSAYGLVEAGSLYNAQYANDHNVRFDISNNVITTTEEHKLNYKGNIKRGTVIVSPKGKVTVCITDGKNSVYKNYSENEVTVANKKECSIPANSSIVYLDGEASIDIVDAKAILDRIDEIDEKIKKTGDKRLDWTNYLHSFSTTAPADLPSGSTYGLSYTATEDCYVVGTIRNDNAYITIGTTQIASVWYPVGGSLATDASENVPLTFVPKGETVTSSNSQGSVKILKILD